MIRGAILLATGALLVLGLSAPVLAGGWAVTTVDEMPAVFEAGVTYEIEYTILQHGQHPADVEATSLMFVPSDGSAPLTFKAESQGEPGIYLAEVALPAAGDWSWSVEQGWFGVQELGPMSVQSAGGSTAAAANTGVVSYLLLAATLLAVVPFVAQLATLRSSRGRIVVADSVG